MAISELSRTRFLDRTEHHYHWYLTNLKVVPTVIYPLYRLKWQVELIFKGCKSSLNADRMTSRNPLISENSVLGIGSGGATITGNGLNTDDWDGYGPGLEIGRNSTASVDRLTVSGNGRGVSVNRSSIFSGGGDGDASNDDYAIVIKDNKQRGLEVRKNSNIDRTYARAMLTAGVLNCSIMYCESMPCLI